MFERYLAEALASHFGHFIENFNADKVKVSVWKGDVILKDLKLKRNALNHLLKGNKNRPDGHHSSSTNHDCSHDHDAKNDNDGNGEDEDEFPCEISYGHIGTFELHIPWSLFRNKQLASSSHSPISPTSCDANTTTGKAYWSSVMGRWGSTTNSSSSLSKVASNAQSKSVGCSITLSDVNILIHPRTNLNKKKTKYGNRNHEHNTAHNNDQEEEKASMLHQDRIQKERQVQKIFDEALFRKNIDFSSLLSSTTSEGDFSSNKSSSNVDAKLKEERSQFFRNLIKNVVSSLSITVRNVHIRYEDTGDCLGFDTTSMIQVGDATGEYNQKAERLRYRPPFAIGVALKEFTVYSSDNGPMRDEEMYSVPDIDIKSNGGKRAQEEKNNESDHNNVFDESYNSLFNLQHKIAAAKRLSVYWDSDLVMNDMIHISAHRRQRRKLRKEKLERKIHTEDDIDISDEDMYYEECSIALNDLESSEKTYESYDTVDNNTGNLCDLYAKMMIKVMERQGERNEKQSLIHRTYIIEPISPSLHFTIVSLLPDAKHVVAPPSRAVLHLPTFQSNFSKDTMDDIAYLRRSFALWNEMRNSLFSRRNNILSRKVCSQLMELRPKVTPLQDPAGWWRYSCEAVKRLSNLKSNNSRQLRGLRRKGWTGLARLLNLRRKYASLYEKLLESRIEDVITKCECSDDLSRMEDSLDVNEIVAFRMYAVCKKIAQLEMKDEETNSTFPPKKSTNLPIWMSSWNQPQKEAKQDGFDVNKEKTYRFFSESEMLSWKQRESVYYEMVDALGTHGLQSYDAFISDIVDNSLSEGVKELQKKVVRSENRLELSIICPQVTLQADDVISHSSTASISVEASRSHNIFCHRPIVQLTFASIQKFCLRNDSSWDVLWTLASVEVLNLMTPLSSSPSSSSSLLTRKRQWTSAPIDDAPKSVQIGRMSYFHSVSVFVQKNKSDNYLVNNEKKSNVLTRIISVNVSPMEVTYSPEPVHAFIQLFSSAQTSELIADYRRLKIALSTWQAQQKRRLMKVLSQRKEKLIIKVDVTAPVFFMHDDVSNGSLLVDLGRMKFHNDISVNESANNRDGWRLLLQDVQVLTLPRPKFIAKPETNLVEHDKTCHIIEPFSLDFKIQTKFGAEEWEDDFARLSSEVLVHATLPRLCFNLTSSSVRLVNRLLWKRDISKAQRSASYEQNKHKDVFVKDSTESKGDYVKARDINQKKSILNFFFSAPLISLHLTNDVDGRNHLPTLDSSQQKIQTPILEFVIQGIGGKLSHTSMESGGQRDLCFSACLNSLYAKDLYQQAGKDYSLLLSSQRPENIHHGSNERKSSQSFYSCVNFDEAQNDLVQIAYDKHCKHWPGIDKGDLKIKFYELYVEFNPETLAAIQKALRLTLEEKDYFLHLPERLYQKILPQSLTFDKTVGKFFQCESSDNSTVFFDTREELEDYGLSSSSNGSSSEMPKRDPNLQPTTDPDLTKVGLFLTPMVLKACEAMSMGKQDYVKNLWNDIENENDFELDDLKTKPQSTISINFELTKLRVRFNKESRLRRLVTAEMNETSVQFESKPFGGMRTTAKVGNLTLTDPSYIQGSTLYGEILGLKRDLCGTDSLLKIEFETFPRDQETSINSHQRENVMKAKDPRMPVKIDVTNGIVYGCDSNISLHFSPMRFVLLQQLWLELIDYFFEGILGCEVWGIIPPNENREKETLKEFLSQVNQDESKKGNMLLGADGVGVRYRFFHVIMDSPTIIVPVTYRSPQHLSFDIEKITLRNQFSSCIEKCSVYDKDFLFKQWYNRCRVHFTDLTLSTWCGAQLSVSDDPKKHDSRSIKNGSIPLDIDVQWPTGPYAQMIVPKWKIHFQLSTFRLLLRKQDYALLRHVLWYNIGEESRHLDEWNLLQNLPPNELQEYKKRIMVHFGYDKKDSPPTTYHFTIDIASIVLHFCSDLSEFVADIDCHSLNWSLCKMKDQISRQKLVCRSLGLEQTSTNEEWARSKKLFIPLEDNELKTPEKNDAGYEQERSPQLIFTSTTRPPGDNVKYIEINDACIILVYPAWIFVKSFFQNLPPPKILKSREVVNSLQVGNRWYKINRDEKEYSQQYDILQEPNVSEETMISLSTEESSYEYQLRINLVGPRIVLLDSSCSINIANETNFGKAVTLQLGHLDFLRLIDLNRTSKKTLFVHDLELFTGFADDAIQRGNRISTENSLLYPLCFAIGSTMMSNQQRLSQCTKWLVADVISARAAFTDMTLAIDVLQKFVTDYFQGNKSSGDKESATSNIQGNESSNESEISESVNIDTGGFDLLVVDDSGRHFANSQELVRLSLYGIKYNCCLGLTKKGPGGDHVLNKDLKSMARLQLKSFEVVDYLQPDSSPFRVVAANKDRCENSPWDSMSKTLSDDVMCWESYAMVMNDWGFDISSNLLTRINMAHNVDWTIRESSNFIEINRKTYVGLRDDVTFRLREIILQWNPSMAIALQRFLGRLKKHIKTTQLISQDTVSEKICQVEEKKFLRVECNICAFTICLNKEHQHRRLMQVTISDTEIVFERDHLCRLNLHGFVGDVNAWDCDGNQNDQINILDSNRLVVCVLRDSVYDESKSCSTNESDQSGAGHQKLDRFLSFQYFCQPSLVAIGNEIKTECQILPQWVIKLVGTDIARAGIDDCLSLSVATIRLNYLRDRTGEIVDYLSNGLPGKGMGATSRAAKGFIQKRIRTHSFLVVSMNAPQVFLPRHRGDEEGVVMSLGNVHLRSWFDESTVEDCESIKCSELSTPDDFKKSDFRVTADNSQRFWWRILSISFTELGWRFHTPRRNSCSMVNPVELHVHLRKPPIDEKIAMIVRCKLSYMDQVLCYLDYVLLRHVLNENVMKPLDKRMWDNVQENVVQTQENGTTNNKSEYTVKYSQDARFVRYGSLSRRNIVDESDLRDKSHSHAHARKTSDDEQDSCHAIVDFKFCLDGLTLVLHRDDPAGASSTTDMMIDLNYDVVSFEVDQVELSVSANSKGAKAATIKLYQLALYDQGDVGRLAREVWEFNNNSICNSKNVRRTKNPSAFSVIAEGYDTSEKNEIDAAIDENGQVIREPQLTVTMDTRPAADVDFGGIVEPCNNAIVTVACIRMNSMNINPLIRPLKDVSNFLFCKWSIGQGHLYSEREKVSLVHEELESHSKMSSNEENRSVNGFQFKIVAHYPRVFLLADESDPTTRALVLRGLAIITTSIINEKISGNVDYGKVHTTVEGHLNSLESYINPQPRILLENDSVQFQPISKDTDVLGIALIEPLTAEFNFHQVKRRYHPLQRQLLLNFESVAMIVSFEDIRLIESVISRWKVASEIEPNEEDEVDDFHKKDYEDDFFSFPHPSDRGSADWDEHPLSDKYTNITQIDSNDVQTPSIYCGGYLPCHGNAEKIVNKEKKDSVITPGKDYSVIFKNRTLGLMLRKSGNSIIVDKILEAECALLVELGDEVIAIGGKNVDGNSLQAVVTKLTNAVRPLSVTFRRVNKCIDESTNDDKSFNEEIWNNNYNYNSYVAHSKSAHDRYEDIIDFKNDPRPLKRRHPFTINIPSELLNNVNIEKSPCGEAAVITSVNESVFQSTITDIDKKYVPKKGNLVLAINKEPLYQMGYQQAKKLLDDIAASNDKVDCEITLVEVTSDDLGSIDKIDIVFSRVSLSIIDDIAGRDMPLLRGTLQSVAVRLEQGLGLECYGIRVNPPSIIAYNTENPYISSDLSEMIVKVFANAETMLDYYNARIASWEPLLEPSHLNVTLENQRGSRNRPGAFSLALSDHQAVDGSLNVRQSLVCLNISDAAAGVLISAFYEWKQWREKNRLDSKLVSNLSFNLLEQESKLSKKQHEKGESINSKANQIKKQSNLELPRKAGLPNTINVIDMKKEAVQNVAHAALIYAKRRGLDSKGVHGAKPFVLRNKTGMRLSFVPQIQENLSGQQDEYQSKSVCFDLHKFIVSSITEVNDGDEACFSMNIIESNGVRSEAGQINQSYNKIRTYDGQFPLLSILLQCSKGNTRVEIAQDLSVVKIGKKLKRLKVEKESVSNTEEGHISVVWSVELEHNRRIITVSSAVTLSSSNCSIPVEVGIKLWDDNLINHREQEGILPIGFVAPDRTCYLPLWIDVCFQRSEVFVRPSSNCHSYHWSSQSIIEFKKHAGASNYHCEASGHTTWKWTISDSKNSSIVCYSNDTHQHSNLTQYPAWLSFEYMRGSLSSEDEDNDHQIISINMFSSLSIRNILPESVEWEVAEVTRSRDGKKYEPLDGSTVRQHNNKYRNPLMKHADTNDSYEIRSGQRKEVLPCNISSMNLEARFRCGDGAVWTEWISINYSIDSTSNEDIKNQVSKPRHVNLQSQNTFDAPLTLGLKIVPKVIYCNNHIEIVKGFDLILHSELWICNLTSLPVTFGAPYSQFFCNSKDNPTFNSGSKRMTSMLNAENALLELSSILEFGDKGHSFTNELNDNSTATEILVIPNQHNDEIVEEIFEYVEMENMSIKRQWWAGENHYSEKPSPTLLESLKINEWDWVDHHWKIDTAGNCSAATGGWESCQNLVGGKSKYFSSSRQYDPYHRFRRRRWYRTRKRCRRKHNLPHTIDSDLSIVFHQPVIDMNSKEQNKSSNIDPTSFVDKESKRMLDVASEIVDEDSSKVYFKIRDGVWSKPAVIPIHGVGHGIVKLYSSRWPEVSKNTPPQKRRRKGADILSNSLAAGTDGPSKVQFSTGCLSPSCYELSYQVSVIEGSWGEFSRLLLLYPRFILRNDSSVWDVHVKQVGAPDSSLIHVRCGTSVPFYWADWTLPELICVRPVQMGSQGQIIQQYQWSGGFDICNLGMTPLRVRETRMKQDKERIPRNQFYGHRDRVFVRVLRSLIEIRSGTGGTGITVSFKEESSDGVDSLYRIENLSPFPLWIAQDGVLANPQYEKGLVITSSTNLTDQFEYHGDLISPGEKTSFGLDVPFRQGKYSGRKAASLEELLTIRIALAPLSMRDGIETMKVVGLTRVASNFRLKPSNLRSFYGEELLSDMMNIGVQGIISADGPTRVLRLILVQRHLSTRNVFRNTVRIHKSPGLHFESAVCHENDLKYKLVEAANEARTLLQQGEIPKGSDIGLSNDPQNLFMSSDIESVDTEKSINSQYSIKACFSGFVVSIIDSVPSEIAVISVKKLNFMATWDHNRVSDATAALSIGWLQIDNHCPNASFPVALSPKLILSEEGDKQNKISEDFLGIGVVFAPHHKSNIMCFKGLTINPRDVSISTDLAFIMRLQYFLLNMQSHVERCHERSRLDTSFCNPSLSWTLPDLKSRFKTKISSSASTTESKKLYFENLVIQPFNIELSVAPANALTNAQYILEGPEAGAIHAAVRKGDLLIGDDTAGVLGVQIGGKNRTALAVIRGIFKSILVDSLLRLDGASMNLSGVRLNNHIATSSQLKTYIGHHYLSLLKSNVPALLGSLAAFGNPVGLIKGFGDGVSDFVSEPIKGIRKSVVELDPTHAMTGVARGTGSLARHTVGGIVDSASLLTETFSKNLSVLTLDRKYAQRRDQFKISPGTSTTFVQGVESGMGKLLRGVAEGVIGVVRAPVRGAEKKGVEGFAKGVGKGLLGLVVKPVIGLSDAVTDVMVGVKGAVEGAGELKPTQLRPRRAFYGNDRSIRPYEIVDAISAAIMMRTRLAGENYLSHVDLGGRVAILGVKRFLLLGDDGETQLLVRLRNIKFVELRQVPRLDESGMDWGILIFLKNTKHGNDIEVITTDDREVAIDLCTKIKHGISIKR